jgi:hypothetical protein
MAERHQFGGDGLAGGAGAEHSDLHRCSPMAAA